MSDAGHPPVDGTPPEAGLPAEEALPPAESEVPAEAAAAADGASPAEPAPAVAVGKGRRRRPWTIVAVVVAAVALLAVIVPIVSTLQPGYYDRYPQLAQRMQAWRESSHSKVACARCHVNPGVGGFLEYAVKAVPDFYSQLFFGPKSTNLLGVPDAEACRTCHTAYREVSPNGDLLIPHKAHVAVLKIDCAVCHKNLVHSVNSKGTHAPTMQTCMVCHNGQRATNQCSKCHTRKEVPASHKQKDWLAVHADASKTIKCGECHGWTPDYCKDCHKKRPPSHTAIWKTTHAAPARENKGRCMVCHTQAFCDKCH